MDNIAIQVQHLSKMYRLGELHRYRTLRDSLAGAIARPLSRLRKRRTEPLSLRPIERSLDSTIWALNDVSFEIRVGEVVGIIGRNGAGKSTLLKILSRITEPTSGRAEIQGRVGSLLEVGTGFHPELTGRENIFLNGAILGMKKAEIIAKFDEIVSFAEVEKFLDTTVKHYSTGMYLRLAFAVAAHLEQEILLIDEVLAVGDAAFQKKCLGKMGEVAKCGRTVLLVSHNMSAIRQLCSQTLWIDEGKVKEIGPPETVIRDYLIGKQEETAVRIWEDPKSAPGGENARLRAIRILGPSGEVGAKLDIKLPFSVEIEYEIFRPIRNFRIGFRLSTSDGVIVFTTADMEGCSTESDPLDPGVYVSRCRIEGNFLNEGDYHILNLWADIPFVRVLFLVEDCLRLCVEQTGGVSGRFGERWAGVICPDLAWTRKRVK